MRYVILGGSIAGLTAVRAIREQDRNGEIIVVTDEPGPAYYRPLIPLLIDGSKQETDLVLTGDLLKQAGANVSVRSAVRVDTASRTVYLSGRKKLAYDRLLIATGARPVVPRVSGLPPRALHLLRTIGHARTIAAAAGSARTAVVIGGGMVGIKAAEALRRRRSPPEVTIVEQQDHVLPQRLDPAGARIISSALEREGIRIVTGTTVRKAYEKNGGITGVTLADGRSLPADMVIAAVGIRSNVDFLLRSGIVVRRGVVVNARLETSVSGVYAAGDAAEYRNCLSGKSFTSGLWTNAVETGRRAGMNMAGGTISGDDFLPVMNAAEIAGIPFISAGIVDPGADCETAVGSKKGSYRKVVLRGSRVVGISFVGDIANAGVYTAMIRNGMPFARERDRVLRGAASRADIPIPL